MKRKILVGAVAGVVLVVSAPPLLPPILKPKPQIKERTQATMAEKKANKALAKEYAWAGYGWRGMEWRCLDYIFTKESRYDHLAKNQQGSSAYGIAQRLKETSKDPAIQILHAYKYIQHRYQTPCRAMKYHLRHNHY
jgi:resuscitation-promoting factor RpfB